MPNVYVAHWINRYEYIFVGAFSAFDRAKIAADEYGRKEWLAVLQAYSSSHKASEYQSCILDIFKSGPLPGGVTECGVTEYKIDSLLP